MKAATASSDSRWGVALVCAGLFVLSIPIAIACSVDIDKPAPMPCHSDEVYVWEDYPRTARCVSSSDHQSHEGHHEPG